MADKPAVPAAKQPNVVVRLWKWFEITPFQIILAAKGALPATIALAAYQGTAFAEIYTTLGYLVAIIATLSLSIQPRAKYIQSLITNLFATCLGAACVLLQIRCVVSARTPAPVASSTGSSGSQEAPIYDASANTTSAVFLMFWVFLANVVKSSRPQLTISMIQFSIFVVVASLYAPNFPTMEAGMSFVRRLLITFLTGYAIATAVSLFLLPVTSRDLVGKQMGGFVKLLSACLNAHGNYLSKVRNVADFRGEASPDEKAAAGQLKGLIGKTNELLGKIKLELNFARREMAFGKLGPEHFTQIFTALRAVYLPINGMTTFLRIVDSMREHNLAYGDSAPQEALKAVKRLEADEWEEVISISKEAYARYQQALLGALRHVALQLEFEKRPKNKAGVDVEKSADALSEPGDANFGKCLEDALYTFQQHRKVIIQDWAKAKNLTIPKHFWRNVVDRPSLHKMQTNMAREKVNQHQLYMMLYLNFLNMAVGRAILKLVRYADSLVEDGTMKKRRVILPGWYRFRELFSSALGAVDSQSNMNSMDNAGSNIYLGDALMSKKDPEHLPATNIYERITDYGRKLPAALRTEHAAFGLRTAVATISIGIIGFVRETRPFFLEQRGLWALIMVAISMDPHAGQGVFGFVARICGTTFAMVSAIVIWYMCDHKAAAILPVFWVYMSCWMVFLLKHPELAVVAMISTITVVLILGYELQVYVIGFQVATSNGQEFYPIALLGVYRLAAVCAGLFAAFVWTYFPFPITTHGALRQDVGSTLYILANYYSCVHTTIDARLHLGPTIQTLPANHPVHRLDAARLKVFGKVLLMIMRLHNHSKFTKFEPPFGGKFPRKAYESLVASIENIFAYISLIEYSSVAYIRTPDELRISRVMTEIASTPGASNMTTPIASHEPSPSQDAEKDVFEKDDQQHDESSQTSDATTTTAPAQAQAPAHNIRSGPLSGSDTVFPAATDPAAEEAWLRSFRHFAASAYQRVTSHALTSTMCLLSSAIKNGQPLPPYYKSPRPFTSTGRSETRKQDREEEDLLDIQHVSHPAFAAFAVGEVASAFAGAELQKVVKGIRELVGEVDFSFHVVGTEHDDEEGAGKMKWWEAMEGKHEENETKEKRS